MRKWNRNVVYKIAADERFVNEGDAFASRIMFKKKFLSLFSRLIAFSGKQIFNTIARMKWKRGKRESIFYLNR